MSVLVEGMDMPTGCISCDFCNPFVEEPYCRRLMKRVPKVTRLDNCPITEIQEPHGDLIDRDKLRAKGFIHDGDAYAVVMSRDIRNAPTVIPASKEAE